VLDVERDESSAEGEETLALATPWLWNRRVRGLVIVIAWLTAAVLAGVAPYRAVFTIQLGGPGISPAVPRTIGGIDGWGNVPDRLVVGVRYGARFGIALWGCAALLLVLVIVFAMSMRQHATPKLARLTDALGIGIPCVLGGVCVSLVLYANGYIDRFNRFSALPGGGVAIPTHLGGCVWLTLAALGFATVASVVHFYSRP
jgi:hypothetical protein